jgi:ligand-binding SRPBCC domain-containing protein
MTTLDNHIDITATPLEVWAVVADLGRLADYDPVVITSTVVGEQQEGLGARRRCNARQGRFFVEEVTVWEPPHRLQFTIVECNLPTRTLTHTYSLKATPSGTSVTQQMQYDMRFGVFGQLLDRLVVRRTSDRGIKGFFTGLKRAVETAPA